MTGKVKTLLISLACTLSLALPFVVTAQAHAIDIINPACQTAQTADKPSFCNQPVQTENPIFGPDGLVTKGLSIFALVIGIIAVIVIIISGLRMVVSGGDSNTITASRNAIIYAVVGLVIAAIAQSLVVFLLRRIGT